MSTSFIKSFCLATIPLCFTASVVQAAEFETLSIKQQTSHYMDMRQTITRIAVGNKDIASVIQLPGSASEFLIVTKAVKGSTALFVWTADGVRHEYLIVVSPEDPGQAMLIEKAIGLPDVHVKFVGDGDSARILLTGTVENQYEKNLALQIARLFVDGSSESSLLVGSGFDMRIDVQDSKSTNSSSNDIDVSRSEAKGKIIDLLQILNPTQIRLEAQIIEINSDAAKEFGLQYGTNGSGGLFSFGEGYTNHSHTTINESYSSSHSNSYSGGNSSYGDNSSYYSSSYADDYSNSNGTNTRNSSNSYSGNNGYSGGSDFTRSVTSTWNDMVKFGNNPIKWVTQHFAPINATLTALVNNGKARILSRPSVVTLSGEQATIHVGGEIPYHEYDSDGKLITNWKDYGIILQFKPVVDAQNRINSMVHAEVSNLNGTTSNGQPIISVRRADSAINLHSGSPIVIGGLMDSSESKRVQKIPLLGDIPILGEFFKHTSKSRDKREIIIVVTPYLVGEEESSYAPMSEPMRDWYNQEEQYRETMENHNFKQPDDEVSADEESEPERILPPSEMPKVEKPFGE